MKKLALLALSILSTNVIAETSIQLGQWSYHFNKDDITNETHKAIGIETGGAFISRFKNSHGNTSVAAGMSVQLYKRPSLDLDLNLALVSGYTNKVTIGFLSAKFGHKNIPLKFELSATPFLVAAGFRYVFK